jgi:hypothetical protein
VPAFFFPARFFGAARFFATGRFFGAGRFFPAFFGAFFFTGAAGLRLGGAFLSAGGLVGGRLPAVLAARSAKDTFGASPKSSGGGELIPSLLMTVRPF